MDIGKPESLLSYSELLTSGSLSLRKWTKFYIRRKTTMYCDSLGLDYGYSSLERDLVWKNEIPDDVISQTKTLNDINNIKLFKENCKRLEYLSELCERRKIKLIILVPPVHELYRVHSNPKQWEIVDDFFDGLSSRFEHVKYKNYYNDNRFIDDDFFDGNHLNADIGGTKFSKIVKEDFEL